MNNPLRWVDPWGLSPAGSNTQSLSSDPLPSATQWSENLALVPCSIRLGSFDPNKLPAGLVDLAKTLVKWLLDAAKSGFATAGALANSLVATLSNRFHVSQAIVISVLTTIVTTFGTGVFDLISPRAQTSDEIPSHSEAAKTAAGQSGALQAHHLIEVRHLLNWGMDDRIGDAPSVVMSREEHEDWTRKLRKELPYGTGYTEERVYEAYKRVYRDKPEWLEGVRRFMNWK